MTKKEQHIIFTVAVLVLGFLIFMLPVEFAQNSPICSGSVCIQDIPTVIGAAQKAENSTTISTAVIIVAATRNPLQEQPVVVKAATSFLESPTVVVYAHRAASLLDFLHGQ